MKTALFLFFALLTTGFVTIPDQEIKSKDELQDRKLNLLEKLEAGKQIDSEEIWSLFGDRNQNDYCLPWNCPMVFSHDDMEELNESLRSSMELLKHELNNLKHSEEFNRAMDEIRKGSEEIKRELEKMREEYRMSDRRTIEWENG